MALTQILILYLAFRVKQFVCDFLLQTEFMALNKSKPGKEGYKALCTHTAIHAMATFLIVLVFAPSFWWLGVVDFVLHSIIDRIKGVCTAKKGWKPADTPFWWVMGLDQEMHNLSHLGYIVFIVLNFDGQSLLF